MEPGEQSEAGRATRTVLSLERLIRRFLRGFLGEGMFLTSTTEQPKLAAESRRCVQIKRLGQGFLRHG